MREFAAGVGPAFAADEERFESVRLDAAALGEPFGGRGLHADDDGDRRHGRARVDPGPDARRRGADDEAASRHVAERIPARRSRSCGGERRGPYTDAVAEQLARLRDGAPRRRRCPTRCSRPFSSPTSSGRRSAPQRSATPLARGPRRPSPRGAPRAGSPPRNRGGHRRRRLLLPLRRPRACDRLRARDRGATRASLDLEVRAGVHTGECQIADEKLAGIAVHVGAG